MYRTEFAMVAEWTEHRKVIGDALTAHAVSERWERFGTAREAALTAAAARLRDLQSSATVSDPRVTVLRRNLDLDKAGEVATRGAWVTVVELEPELKLQVEP
jgi:hypothetical protein